MDEPPTSRFLDVELLGDRLRVSYRRCLADSFGLTLRERELRLRIKARLRRVASLERADHGHILTLRHPMDMAEAIQPVLAVLDRIVEAIATRPLTPRQVEEALGITARERLRWSKDGRLPRSGSGSLRKGQIVTFQTYAVEAVAALAADPSVIAAWRSADEAPTTAPTSALTPPDGGATVAPDGSPTARGPGD